MSKTIRPAVAFTTITAALKKAKSEGKKFSVEEMAHWLKVEGPNGHAIYVAKTEQVRQVDLKGFVAPAGTFPSDGKNGNITAHLDLRHGEEFAIQALNNLLDTMQDSVAVLEKRGRKAKTVDLSSAIEDLIDSE